MNKLYGFVALIASFAVFYADGMQQEGLQERKNNVKRNLGVNFDNPNPDLGASFNQIQHNLNILEYQIRQNKNAKFGPETAASEKKPSNNG